MEKDTVSKLQAAGASELLIEYYKRAPKSASAVREIENGPFSVEELAEKPSVGGGFFQALWNGDRETARFRADSQNRSIIEGEL